MKRICLVVLLCCGACSYVPVLNSSLWLRPKMSGWPSAPVCLSVGAATSRATTTYGQAATALNEALGLRLLTTDCRDHMPTVRLHSGPLRPGWAGLCRFDHNPLGMSSADVWLDPVVYRLGISLEVAQHEIGHALGLDHSTDPDCLMYGSVRRGHQWCAETLADLRTHYAPLLR